MEGLIKEAKCQRMGVAILVRHETAGLGRRKRVSLWIPDQGPDWKMEMEFTGCNRFIMFIYPGQWR